MSFAIVDAETNTAVGGIGLWLQNLPAGRATAGYSVSAKHRGRGAVGRGSGSRDGRRATSSTNEHGSAGPHAEPPNGLLVHRLLLDARTHGGTPE